MRDTNTTPSLSRQIARQADDDGCWSEPGSTCRTPTLNRRISVKIIDIFSFIKTLRHSNVVRDSVRVFLRDSQFHIRIMQDLLQPK